MLCVQWTAPHCVCLQWTGPHSVSTVDSTKLCVYNRQDHTVCVYSGQYHILCVCSGQHHTLCVQWTGPHCVSTMDRTSLCVILSIVNIAPLLFQGGTTCWQFLSLSSASSAVAPLHSLINPDRLWDHDMTQEKLWPSNVANYLLLIW